VNRRLWLGLAVSLALVGAVTAALSRAPWDPDETRYLVVARELVEAGNPLLLTFNGTPYPDKPPLFFWLLAPAVALLGATSTLAAVLPSLVALPLFAAAVARLGRTAGLEAGTSRLGALLAATALLPALLAAACRMDLPFAVLTALALDRLVALAADDDSHRRRDHLLLWLWLGLGVMTKGPVALALPLGAAALVAVRDPGPLRRALAGPGPLLAVALVAAWLVPAGLAAGRGWVLEIVVNQTAGRMASSFAHREPWWYHLATVPATLLPWSPAVLAGLAATLSRHRRAPTPVLLLAAYPVVTLVLLSLVSGKTLLYPLPLFAPACLVAARWLIAAPSGPARRAAVAAGASAMLLVGCGLAIVVAPRPDMALRPAAAALLCASVAAPAAAALITVRRLDRSIAALALAAPCLLAVGLQTLVGPFDRMLSLAPFGAALARLEPDQALPGIAYGKLQPGFVLFSGRRFELLDEPAALARALGNGRAVAINVKEARRLESEHGLRLPVAAELPYRHTTILLLRSP